MTNETEAQLPAPITPPAPKSVRLWPIWLFIVAIIVVMAALAVYGWGELQKIEQVQLKIDFVEERDSNKSQGLSRLESRLDKRITNVESLTRNQSDKIAQQDRTISFNARQLAQVGGQSRTDWLLAEAEYLLRLANQRLRMEKDFIGAEAIMTAADRVLAESDDPGLYAVREQLAKEVMALQRVSHIDREGIYLKLEALIDLTEKLDQRYYLAQDQEEFLSQLADDNTVEPDPSQSEMTRLLEQMAGELKKLVVIRRLDEPVEPLLAPEQIYYLKQNLRLMLEQAELGLLNRNQEMYERSLNKADAWVRTYFLQERQDTELLLSTLQTLKAKQINPILPDISQSLTLLKDRVALIYRQHTINRQPQASAKTSTPAIVKAEEPEKESPKAESSQNTPPADTPSTSPTLPASPASPASPTTPAAPATPTPNTTAPALAPVTEQPPVNGANKP